jgi:hypothetical protein
LSTLREERGQAWSSARAIGDRDYPKAIKYKQDPHKKNEIMNNLYKEGGTWDT